jgi:hypothetical protein
MGRCVLVMIWIPCALPWLYDFLSTGWNEVSLRLSKPVANSIWGTVHEPKSPTAELALALELAAVASAAAAPDEDASVAAAASAVTVTVTLRRASEPWREVYVARALTPTRTPSRRPWR